ncbi:uncharacterized protein [Drosophila suzukii]|uniref:Uncharacterized protein n=1 Tax=Drosophila suzukii TaxID=28584 RepID=A0ABM4TNL7_DROSZ
MIAQFAGQNQRDWNEKWPEIMLAVSTSVSESTGYTPSFITQGREPRLPSALYGIETVGTGRPTEAPEENAKNLEEIFEIARRNLERASEDQARHYNLRRTDANESKDNSNDSQRTLRKESKDNSKDSQRILRKESKDNSKDSQRTLRKESKDISKGSKRILRKSPRITPRILKGRSEDPVRGKDGRKPGLPEPRGGSPGGAFPSRSSAPSATSSWWKTRGWTSFDGGFEEPSTEWTGKEPPQDQQAPGSHAESVAAATMEYRRKCEARRRSAERRLKEMEESPEWQAQQQLGRPPDHLRRGSGSHHRSNNLNTESSNNSSSHHRSNSPSIDSSNNAINASSNIPAAHVSHSTRTFVAEGVRWRQQTVVWERDGKHGARRAAGTGALGVARTRGRAVKAYEEQDCYDEIFGIGIPGISELRRNTERATRSVPDNKEKARTADPPRESKSSRAATESTRQGRAASEHLQGASKIFREPQDWSTVSKRREVVETTRTVGSTEGHK